MTSWSLYMSRASARSIKDWHDRAYVQPACRPAASDHENMVHKAIEPIDLQKSPTTGRNTKMGRKAEKPRDPRSGGPSGQKERARHDKRHANK